MTHLKGATVQELLPWNGKPSHLNLELKLYRETQIIRSRKIFLRSLNDSVERRVCNPLSLLADSMLCLRAMVRFSGPMTLRGLLL